MSEHNSKNRVDDLLVLDKKFPLHVTTMGNFQVFREGASIAYKDWGRDKTIQLFQFLITARHRRGLHKEEIISRLWEDADGKTGDRDFKVALHGINKVLEPERRVRTGFRYILRNGSTYQINPEEVSIDIDLMEKLIALGNELMIDQPEVAIHAYRHAIKLHGGIYLPNRLYEDWTSAERERIQVIILGTYHTLAEMLVDSNPMECIRLSQEALLIDPTWEDAYRIQMSAYEKRGNRPLAIKTFERCKKMLETEFGIEPLPETSALMNKIMGQ